MDNHTSQNAEDEQRLTKGGNVQGAGQNSNRRPDSSFSSDDIRTAISKVHFKKISKVNLMILVVILSTVIGTCTGVNLMHMVAGPPSPLHLGPQETGSVSGYGQQAIPIELNAGSALFTIELESTDYNTVYIELKDAYAGWHTRLLTQQFSCEITTVVQITYTGRHYLAVAASQDDHWEISWE